MKVIEEERDCLAFAGRHVFSGGTFLVYVTRGRFHDEVAG
jgi:hypothetical protein